MDILAYEYYRDRQRQRLISKIEAIAKKPRGQQKNEQGIPAHLAPLYLQLTLDD